MAKVKKSAKAAKGVDSKPKAKKAAATNGELRLDGQVARARSAPMRRRARTRRSPAAFSGCRRATTRSSAGSRRA